jgi:NTE family protein
MRTFSHPVSTQPAVSHRPSLAPRTAFVLAGGGILGALQVGMPRGLHERGVAPDLLVGPSAAARLQSDLARYATAAKLIVLPAVNRGRIRPTDFDHASRLIAHALAAASTALAPQVVEPVAA